MTDPTTTLFGAGDLIPPLPKPIPDLTRWYEWHEVSRDIWDGDIWWWDNGEIIFPVNIAWSPTSESFFATLGQWGWGRAQDLSEMQGRWMPCVEPEPDEKYRETVGDPTW